MLLPGRTGMSTKGKEVCLQCGGSSWISQRTGLLFAGSCGTGKTHLAVAVINELMQEKQVPSLFYDYRELLQDIKNSWNHNVEATELSVLRPVFEAEILLLDELGAVRSTEW